MAGQNGRPHLDVAIQHLLGDVHAFEWRRDSRVIGRDYCNLYNEVERKAASERLSDRHSEYSSNEVARLLNDAALQLPTSKTETAAVWPTEEYDGADLLTVDTEIPYIITDVLDAVQPAIVGGGNKAMKTGTMLDMAISIASGTPFLGKFDVVNRCPVGFMTGEAGIATVSKKARLIAGQRGVDLAGIRDHIYITPQLPNLCTPDGTKSLLDWCLRRKLRVAIIDPAYLSFPGMAEVSNNVFGIGELLRRFAGEALKQNVLPVVVHHSIKSPTKFQGEPLDLTDLSGSGWCEFAGQWLLLNRYEAYVDGSRQHALNLRIGGRSGHSSLWRVDLEEDSWDVTIETFSRAKADDSEKRDAAKRRKQEETEQSHVRKALRAFDIFPDGESKTRLQETSGLNPAHFGEALGVLLRDQVVEPCEVNKGRLIQGYRRKKR